MTKKEQKPYTTEDLKKAIQAMEDEKLDLTAPLEISLEGDDDHYEIESIGHFHVIPNMTIRLKLKGYVKKNGDHALTLRQFLKLYNFRNIVNEKENTKIIRIYTEWPSEWFEFGVNDWNYGNTDDRIKSFIHPEVLDKQVSSIEYDETNEVFSITLYEGDSDES